MAGTVGALATGMIAGAYGGQNKSVVTYNLELRAFRTDCGTRDAAFRLSSGAGVTDLPASALDAAGGGSCEGGAPADVDVKVVRLKNVYASEGDGAISDLLQIELGGEGATVKVDNLAEPIVFDIPFDYDPTLEAGYDPGIRTGTCYNRSQVLSFDCDVPTTFDCGESREVTLPDGSTMNATSANLPLEITVSCPAKTAACSFWDNGWSSDGCSVVASTASGVTCACSHLTDFAASTTAADAEYFVDFQPSPGPTPAPTTGQPSLAPTSQPSPGPTTRPTWVPWPAPTTARPTPRPSPAPTPLPGHPTAAPVFAPTPPPSAPPTAAPGGSTPGSYSYSYSPTTYAPTAVETYSPTTTYAPTAVETYSPTTTYAPTAVETYSPTNRGQCLVDADCAALPGCDQPDLVTCYRGSCYTGTLDDRCDGQENGFHLGDGGWCWGGRRDQPCYGDDEDGDEDGDEGPCDICDGRGVKADTVAGYTCETAAGEKVGDSNTHPAMAFAVFNTAADCLTAGHSWNAYTCEDAARFWAEDEDQWNLGWTCQFHQDFWDSGGEAGAAASPPTTTTTTTTVATAASSSPREYGASRRWASR